MKKRRFSPQLSNQQQLILGLLLVIVVAISLLYCLGAASLVLRQAWESAPLPWADVDSPIESQEPVSTPIVEPNNGNLAPLDP